MPLRILAINPGSTSTKVAVYEDETPLFVTTLRHSAEALRAFRRNADQYAMRRDSLLSLLAENDVALNSLHAVVGRGGILRPLASGTYHVRQKMLDHLLDRSTLDHASNLGAPLAHEIATRAGVPAFTVDSVAVDEFEPVARLSGLPEIPRLSISHALNVKAIARRAALDRQQRYEDLNLVVVHLGGGISVTAHRRGRMIDVNNASDAGPFAPERAGTLPLHGFIDLCFSGRYSAEGLKRLIMGQSGLVAHLGTNSTIEVEARIAAGDSQARLVYDAMAYNVAKEIGAMATVLEGEVDAIILTGGSAHSHLLVDWIRRRVSFIAQVVTYPGEDEMLSLAQGALRVLRGDEEAREYDG
ncbi:MAG: butyrate kinase [Chloroflexota bacterium]